MASQSVQRVRVPRTPEGHQHSHPPVGHSRGTLKGDNEREGKEAVVMTRSPCSTQDHATVGNRGTALGIALSHTETSPKTTSKN